MRSAHQFLTGDPDNVLAQQMQHGGVVGAAVHQVQHLVAEREALCQAVGQGICPQEQGQSEPAEPSELCFRPAP